MLTKKEKLKINFLKSITVTYRPNIFLYTSKTQTISKQMSQKEEIRDVVLMDNPQHKTLTAKKKIKEALRHIAE